MKRFIAFLFLMLCSTVFGAKYFFETTASSGKYLWSYDNSGGAGSNWSSTASPTFTATTKPADGDTVTITAAKTCTFDNTDAYANGLASLIINGTLDAYTTAGTYVLKMAGNVTGTGTISAGTVGTAYPTNCSLTITFNGAYGFTTALLWQVYCTTPAHPMIQIAGAAEAVGQTTLTVDTNVYAEWASGQTVCIVDNVAATAPEAGLYTLGTLTNTTEIVITSGLAAQKEVGAWIFLVNRNVTILGSGTTNVIAAWAAGSYIRCSLQPAANSSSGLYYASSNSLEFAGIICPQSLTGSTGKGAVSVTGNLTFSGIICGCSYGLSSCIGVTVSGTVSGCTYGLNACLGVTVSGTVSGCSNGLYSCTGVTVSGTVSGCTYGLYSCIGVTVSGTVSGCTFGLYSCTGYLSGSTFTGNTYDIRRSPSVFAYNTTLADTENYEYATLNANNYAESIDHDKSAGAFKAWTKGGIVTHQTASPPTGYAVYFRHTGDSDTNYCFKQTAFAVGPGKTLTVTGFAKLSGTLASADDARLQIIDQFADPLCDAANTPLATASVADRTDATNWQALSVNWTNSGTLRRLVWIRTIMRSATVYVDFAESSDGAALTLVDYGGIPIENIHKLESSTTDTYVALNDAADYVGSVFVARKTANIDRVNFFIPAAYSNTSSTKVTAYIDHVAATGYPDGGHHATQELAGPFSLTALNTITFGTPYQVTAGTTYAVYLVNTSATPATYTESIWGYRVCRGSHLFPMVIYNTTASDTRQAQALPAIFPQYSDGEIPDGFTRGNATVVTVASDTTPDEIANCFTVANSWVCKGAMVYLVIPNNGDFSVNLYEDTSSTAHTAAIRTVALDEDILNANSYGWIYVEWADYTCTPNHTYRISVLPTTTTAGFTILDYTFSSLATMTASINYPCYEAVRTDAGDWTPYNTGTFKYTNIVPLMGNLSIFGGSSTVILGNNTNGGFN
jgi:hypothetical protein